MTENNTEYTHKQKIGHGISQTVQAIVAVVAVVFCFVLGKVAWGAKQVSSGVEYAAERGQEWSANKVAQKSGQAVSDYKEAYKLYKKQPAKQNDKVEDEGYHSGSENLTA